MKKKTARGKSTLIKITIDLPVYCLRFLETAAEIADVELSQLVTCLLAVDIAVKIQDGTIAPQRHQPVKAK